MCTVQALSGNQLATLGRDQVLMMTQAQKDALSPEQQNAVATAGSGDDAVLNNAEEDYRPSAGTRKFLSGQSQSLQAPYN